MLGITHPKPAISLKTAAKDAGRTTDHRQGKPKRKNPQNEERNAADFQGEGFPVTVGTFKKKGAYMNGKEHETGREALESEPTEGATFSPATVGTLKRLEEETYSAYGVNSKPPGFTWINMALDIAWKITNEPGLLDTITEADLDQLTEENFHTARHAAEVALHLKKYII